MSLMVCRVTAYRLSPSSGARLSFLTGVWKQAGIFSNASSCEAVGRWVPQACAYTPGASGHILRHADEYPLSSLLNNIEAAGIAVHILPAQFENFRGAKAGPQGQQSHIVQLRMPLFKAVQKGLDFLSGQETNLSLLAFTIFQVPPLVDKGLTPLHMPVAPARFMAERIKLKMLLTVCPASIFRVGALALGFLVAFLGFVFPVGVFKSCALRLESKFGVRSAIGKAWILALGWAQYWL